MKVFVSGQIKEAAYIQHVYQKLISNGHEITHDWTVTDSFLSTPEAKLADVDESGRRAAADIQGVVDCDAYILCANNANPGKGMYVELGAALGRWHINQTPRIYILGPMNHSHMTVFYLHAATRHFDTIDEVIDDMAVLL